MSSPTEYKRTPDGIDPPRLFPAYASTVKRAPRHPPVRMTQSISEITGPNLGREFVRDGGADLARFDGGDALGERIVVSGRVLDEDGRAIPNALIEIWQANACGRYAHRGDQHHAPLDPHFLGVGRTVTNEGGEYRFMTIRPGAYPWKNHHNAWRPSHIHFSLFGPAVATRLITQMYFPGDPLLALDPIFNSIPDRAARERLISTFDINLTVPEYALGYRFDFVVRGRTATPALG